MNRQFISLGRFCFAVLAIAFITGCTATETDPVSEPPANQYIERGRMLVKGFAACGFCHGETPDISAVLSGGRKQNDKYGDVKAPNITPANSGVREWTTMDYLHLFRTFTNRSGNRISSELHRGFEWLSDSDIFAIVSYLKNLPPVENEVDRRSVSFVERNTVGVMEADREVSGHVPDIDKSYQLEYGEYIVNQVARCGSCHNTPPTLFDSEKYLSGGNIIKNEFGEKLAPNITTSEDLGIGSWSEDEIVEYLQTGVGPGNRESDSNFCPTGFYRNGLPEDLISVAKYLKSVSPNN